MKKEELPQNNQNKMINWKSFLDDFYQPIIISDKKGNHLYVNKAACHLTGYSKTELLGIGMQGLSDPELLKELSLMLKKRLNGDPLPFSYDFKIILKDKTKLDVKVNGHRIMWGYQPADLVALYNISTRKKDEHWFQVKKKFSENLNKIFSNELCLKFTCKLIEDEKIFNKSALVIHNQSNHLINIGYNGVGEDIIHKLRQSKPLAKEKLTQLAKSDYKIGNSFFLPDDYIKTIFPDYLDFPGTIESSPDLTLWQPGDALIVPFFSEANIWIGNLTVADPCNGKRPDLKTVGKLEELLYILSKRLTEIKHHELIYESEQRYRAITEQSILPIAVFFRDHYIYVNKAFCDLSGYSSKEILSWHQDESRKLIHPDDLEKLLQFDENNTSKFDETSKLLIRGVRKSGEIRWLERFAKKINYYGVISELIILVDRTKEVLAERNLQVSEEQLRTLLGATDDSVLLINSKGLILNLNKHYADLVGKDLNTLPNTYVWDLFQAEDIQTRKDQVKQVIESRQPLHINERKGKKYLKTNLYPIFNNQNKVEWIAVYVNDVTEELEVTRKLFQAEKMAAIGNITSGIVHQIRNPLGNISFAAQLGLQQEGLNDTLREYLELILNDVDQANLVIKKLVEYNDPYVIELVRGNILEPIYKAVSLSKPRMEAKNIQLTFEHPDKLPKFKISEYWLEHTFINIINNSIQAIKKDGKIEIKVFLDPSKTKLIISIKDNGCGIPQTNLSQIYDPFFTTEENGVGLGLSLVSKIIELHNGTVQIDSKEKEFTVVTLTLPIKKQQNKYYQMMSFPF